MLMLSECHFLHAFYNLRYYVQSLAIRLEGAFDLCKSNKLIWISLKYTINVSFSASQPFTMYRE